jgi:DNA-binding response OmpR family regulator
MKNILIIEDDPKIAMALTLRLKSAGYEATAAYDALTGLNAVINNPPDLVVLDICLPIGNGFTLSERIQTFRPTPIIFVTASKRPGFRQKADELGAAGYFEKPYEAGELLSAIHSALNPSAPLIPASKT